MRLLLWQPVDRSPGAEVAFKEHGATRLKDLVIVLELREIKEVVIPLSYGVRAFPAVPTSPSC
jgi:hypothetical protein